MEHWTEYSRFIIALFVILDPFAAVPIFLALTKTYSNTERARIANISAASVLMVLVAASLTGEAVLTGMGTSLASFRVGGGIVLLLMALAMLNGQTGSVRTTPEEIESIARHIGEYCNAALGPYALVIPMKGFSAFDAKGGPLYDPQAPARFVKSLQAQLSDPSRIHTLPYHINDSEFSEAVMSRLQELLALK